MTRTLAHAAASAFALVIFFAFVLSTLALMAVN